MMMTAVGGPYVIVRAEHRARADGDGLLAGGRVERAGREPLEVLTLGRALHEADRPHLREQSQQRGSIPAADRIRVADRTVDGFSGAHLPSPTAGEPRLYQTIGQVPKMVNETNGRCVPMHEVAIIEAVRTPVGRRNGALAMTHANDLLGSVLTALLDRTGLAGEQIGEVFGGCVGQYGMQASNVTRNAWLAAGLPVDVPATTVNVNCGSSQEAVTVAYGQIRGGLTDVAIAC